MVAIIRTGATQVHKYGEAGRADRAAEGVGHHLPTSNVEMATGFR